GRADRREHASAQPDLGDIPLDRSGELDLPARRERQPERGLRGRAAARRRAAPGPAPRVLARAPAGPLVADRLAALEVVDARGARALLELLAVVDELAPTDDRRRRLEHEVVLEVLAVARVQAREHEVIAPPARDAAPHRRCGPARRRAARGRARGGELR